jgi:hypothetical protein
MNDFSELEAELKQLRPAPVGDQLFRRIERALLAQPEATPTAGILPRQPSAPASGGRSGSAWPLPACSSCLARIFPRAAHRPDCRQEHGHKPLLTSGFQPSTLTQVVYRQRDEGLVFSPNQSERLLRRVRYDTRETMQWRNPQTGASLRVSYPAEQVVLTPVSFQ